MLLRHTWLVVCLYGLAHFGVDFGCAYTAFSAKGWGATGFLLYNFCAFAMQMPLGLVADRLRSGKTMALLGSILVGLLCLIPHPPMLFSVVLGLGNGLFHVGAGHGVLALSNRGKMAPLGVFVSPGALGIGFGKLAAESMKNRDVALLVLALGLLSHLVCLRVRLPKSAALAFPKRAGNLLPGLLLFAVVVLRSVGGMAAPTDWKWGIWINLAVCATALGKAAGGFMADLWGKRNVGLLSLGLSALCFLFCGAHPFWGVLGVFCFQMTMPITLFEMAERMPGCKTFSFGILTFALFIGFLPTWFGLGSLTRTGMAWMVLLSGAMLLPALGKE